MSLTFECADPVERAEGLDTAVDSIRRGELVVMPVDASYGLAADAFQPAAVDALAASKGRGRTCRSRSWSAPGPASTG